MKKTAIACGRCGGHDPCGAAQYCSQECERAHWKGGHDLVCVSLEKRQPAPPKEGDECAICLNPVETNTICTLMCDHSFHVDCLKKMVGKGGRTCPLCRAALPPSEIFPAPDVDVRLCRLGIELNPSKTTFLTLFALLNNEEMRIKAMVEAIHNYPKDPFLRNLLATAFIRQGDPSSAIKQFNAVLLSCKPLIMTYSDLTVTTMSDASYNIAVAFFDLGKTHQSIFEVDRLIRHRSAMKGNYHVSDLFNLRGCNLARVHDPRAQIDFKRAVQMKPENKSAMSNWAKWLMPHEPHRAARMFYKLGIDAAYTYRCPYCLELP